MKFSAYFVAEVTAVFRILENLNVACYMHIGQTAYVIGNFNTISKPATPEQYADLYKELESIGYKLKVIKRRNHAKYLQAYKTLLIQKPLKINNYENFYLDQTNKCHK